MQKPQKYDIQQTNIAMLGSDLEYEIRKNAATHEEAWQEVGKEVGLWIWRIEKFKVVAWPKESYGQFFNGDSYIILNTFKKNPNSAALSHNIHFWLGEESTSDEYGTAAYKTVELDSYLGCTAVQHREVQGSESKLFLTYFERFEIMKGGIESGYVHVEEEVFRPRLLHIKGVKGRVVVVEKDLKASSLNSGDCFILDIGTTAYLWSGRDSNSEERKISSAFLRSIRDDRQGKCKIFMIDQDDEAGTDAREFWTLLEGKPEEGIADATAGGDDEHIKFEKQLFRLSDESGEMTFTKEASGAIFRRMFDTKDVFIFDAGFQVFIWIGQESTAWERLRGFEFAQRYLDHFNRPKTLPITRIMENGDSSPVFELALSPEVSDLKPEVVVTIAKAMRHRRIKHELAKKEQERIEEEKRKAHEQLAAQVPDAVKSTLLRAITKRKNAERERLEIEHQKELKRQQEELERNKLPLSVRETLKKAMEARKKKKEEELQKSHSQNVVDMTHEELKPMTEKLPDNVVSTIRRAATLRREKIEREKQELMRKHLEEQEAAQKEQKLVDNMPEHIKATIRRATLRRKEKLQKAAEAPPPEPAPVESQPEKLIDAMPDHVKQTILRAAMNRRKRQSTLSVQLDEGSVPEQASLSASSTPRDSSTLTPKGPTTPKDPPTPKGPPTPRDPPTPKGPTTPRESLTPRAATPNNFEAAEPSPASSPAPAGRPENPSPASSPASSPAPRRNLWSTFAASDVLERTASEPIPSRSSRLFDDSSSSADKVDSPLDYEKKIAAMRNKPAAAPKEDITSKWKLLVKSSVAAEKSPTDAPKSPSRGPPPVIPPEPVLSELDQKRASLRRAPSLKAVATVTLSADEKKALVDDIEKKQRIRRSTIRADEQPEWALARTQKFEDDSQLSRTQSAPVASDTPVTVLPSLLRARSTRRRPQDQAAAASAPAAAVPPQQGN